RCSAAAATTRSRSPSMWRERASERPGGSRAVNDPAGTGARHGGPAREGGGVRLAPRGGVFPEEAPAGDAVLHRVYGIPAPATGANLLCSTTVLEPGTAGREYYMTQGHFHQVRDRAEGYLGLAGEGRLV